MNVFAKTLNPILALLGLLFLVTASAAASIGPKAVISATVDEVIQVLANDSLDRGQRLDSIRELMLKHFDFLTMSRSVLAINWRDASPEQQKQFLKLFPELLLHTYMAGLEGYTDEVVNVDDAKMKGAAKAIVDTTIISSGKAIPVSYRLRDNDGTWYIYDVIVEGVSLVNNYRGTFGSTIQRQGMDQLLDNLKTKIDELQKPKEG